MYMISSQEINGIFFSSQHQRNSLATIVLISNAINSAYYLKDEIASAIAFHRKQPDTHKLIPVYLNGIPTDSYEIPYGLRTLHSLDAISLGFEGVATELRAMAKELDVLNAQIVPEITLNSVNKVVLFDALCKLLPSMFEEVLLRVDAPTNHIAPSNQPLANRALDLIQWSELKGNKGLSELSRTINRVAPNIMNI